MVSNIFITYVLINFFYRKVKQFLWCLKSWKFRGNVMITLTIVPVECEKPTATFIKAIILILPTPDPAHL